MTRITAPQPNVLQVSGETAKGAPVLSVLVKRTYHVGPRGQLSHETEQSPLSAAIIDKEKRNLLLRDADIYALKPLTDVVAMGHAYPARGERRLTAGIRVGAIEKQVLVSGDRRASLSSGGQARFSEPEPFDRMPLAYDRAYGGLDAEAHERYGGVFDHLRPYLPPEVDLALHSPYLYPRNPSGKGYVIAPVDAAVERAELPNLEDPSDPLRADRFFAGSPRRWPWMPLPWALGWQSMAAFPRIGFTGAVRDHEPLEGPFPEEQRGIVPEGFPRVGRIEDVFDDRFWNGASPGLQIGPLGTGVERLTFELSHMHPSRPSWSFQLPAGAPVIKTDGRKGKLNDTTAVLHSVVIEPDEDRVTVLWRGSSPALRRYLLEELLKMPLLVEW